MSGRLEGKVALITGTASGMGRAAAIRFAQEGAHVFGCDISAERNNETKAMVEAAGFSMTATAPVDLSDPEQCQNWIDDSAAVYGHIDVLFNNASSPRFGITPEFSVDDWRYTMRNELDLVFFATKFAWPHLAKRGGVVISTASTAGYIATRGAGMAAHCAAKGGVLALSKAFACDGVEYGIRSVTLSPGGIRTPELERNFLKKVPGAEKKLLGAMLSRRIGEVEDIASLAVFLASDEASYLNGVDVLADGGMTAI